MTIMEDAVDYQVVRFDEDRTYVGLRYDKDAVDDMPAFWELFTEKLYTSELVNHLIEGHEAIGYRRYPRGRDDDLSHDYYAGCQLKTPIDHLCGFHSMVIPKGEYLIFKVRYAAKDEDIARVLNDVLPTLSGSYDIDPRYDFEYYTETFVYQDDNTHLYFAIPLITK